jgi:hypothetical protein
MRPRRPEQALQCLTHTARTGHILGHDPPLVQTHPQGVVTLDGIHQSITNGHPLEFFAKRAEHPVEDYEHAAEIGI